MTTATQKLAREAGKKWSIGLYAGPTPMELNPVSRVLNPVLTCRDVTDLEARFVADPFMMRGEKDWYMFFEAEGLHSRKGEIALASSPDGLLWTYRQIVLKEDFHLSYPFVFQWENAFYMLPETQQAGSIRLYRSTRFPFEWQHEANLIEGAHADPTLLRHNNKWWLFASEEPDHFDSLCLYLAEQLTGPWKKHPQAPLRSGDIHRSRPAGRIVRWNDRLIRFAQDGHPHYGTRVRAMEIVELTETRYAEKELAVSPVLQASREPGAWNGRGMHHLDTHQLDDGSWLACVDGHFLEP